MAAAAAAAVVAAAVAARLGEVEVRRPAATVRRPPRRTRHKRRHPGSARLRTSRKIAVTWSSVRGNWRQLLFSSMPCPAPAGAGRHKLAALAKRLTSRAIVCTFPSAGDSGGWPCQKDSAPIVAPNLVKGLRFAPPAARRPPPLRPHSPASSRRPKWLSQTPRGSPSSPARRRPSPSRLVFVVAQPLRRMSNLLIANPSRRAPSRRPGRSSSAALLGFAS